MRQISQAYNNLNRRGIDEMVRYMRGELKIKVPITMEELERVIVILGGGLEGVGMDEIVGDSELKNDIESFVIKYKTDIDKRIAMFSICSELGHLILHLLGEDGKFSREYKVNGYTEYEMNEFSAELMMPEDEFKRVNIELMEMNVVDLEGIAKRFNVTLHMANVRGSVLNLW